MATNSTAGNPVSDLRTQWKNPGDILSLLLLIGGDIVQKAIAQLIGFEIRIPTRRRHGLSIAPVAFSFGWVAFGFSNLLSAIGDGRLMPAAESSSFVVNCSNGFSRETRSWLLSRILRDHEAKFEVDPRSVEEGGRAESLRVDIFTMGPVKGPALDAVWWMGWGTILVQIGIAVVPWVLYGAWDVMLVALCGNLMAAVTCALPQWKQEKWAGRKLGADKVTCLTRGNGSFHVMVFVGCRGAWDLESLATGVSAPRPETRWLSLAFAILWTALLITVAGMKQYTWFLVCIGGIGMLQNVVAAGVSRELSAFNFHATPFVRAPTIIGIRQRPVTDENADADTEEDVSSLADLTTWAPEKPKKNGPRPPPSDPKMPSWLRTMSRDDGVPEWLEAIKPGSHINGGGQQPGPVVYAGGGVHGALIELEKWVPTAGLAMVPVFFPGSLAYNDDVVRHNAQKRFWKRAYRSVAIRKRAEEKRRAAETLGEAERDHP